MPATTACSPRRPGRAAPRRDRASARRRLCRRGTQERAPPPSSPSRPRLLWRISTEGSFFVGEDKTLLQVQDGEAVPVTHGDTPLKANGTMMGQRLAALIALRDQARHVLQSQNEGWPDAHRQATRRALNRLYDRFVAAYGPINKTTISTTDDGNVIRRMPNLVKFRDDPDAMLVMALEDYDEATGTAEKAAIMHHDVVGRSPPITTVHSAEEGLLVSLDQRGVVDLPYIATLYSGSPRQIIAELGDLIYQDPDTQAWQTADVYLSGNVRAKLAAAERPVRPTPAMSRPCAPCSPRTCCPATSTPTWARRGYPSRHPGLCRRALRRAASTPSRSATCKKDALWSVDAGRQREGLGGRHHGLRHGPRGRRGAAGAGPQPEKPHHL